jgi:hypothetical protein
MMRFDPSKSAGGVVENAGGQVYRTIIDYEPVLWQAGLCCHRSEQAGQHFLFVTRRRYGE